MRAMFWGDATVLKAILNDFPNSSIVIEVIAMIAGRLSIIWDWPTSGQVSL
jgi:hypothetical protein